MKIKFVCKHIDQKTKEKFPTKKEISFYAENMIDDYCIQFKRSPFDIDYDEFVSKYLKIDIQYQRLSLDNSILGATIQKNGYLITYSYDWTPKKIKVHRGDIFIDEEACGCEQRILFTIFHEIKHKLLDLDKDFRVDKILDDKDMIEGEFHTRTKLGWAEYFANYFAVCILLNKRRIKSLYKLKHDKYVTQKHTSLNGKKVKILRRIIKEISNETGVSQTAIVIRLKELELITEATFQRLDYKFGKDAVMMFRNNHRKEVK